MTWWRTKKSLLLRIAWMTNAGCEKLHLVGYTREERVVTLVMGKFGS